MSAAEELNEYARTAFYEWSALRDARDEALTRVQELTDERDRARATAVALEQQLAAIRRAFDRYGNLPAWELHLLLPDGVL